MPVAARQATSVSLHDYLDPIFHATCAEADHLAIAVSGGADSMALCLLAKIWGDVRGIRLTALTVNHGLRAEAAAEAAQVAAWMQHHGMAHHTLSPAPDTTIGNLQTRARTMRYNALTDWCRAHQVPILLVAHHADDQSETVALQQHRGDSPPSRAGMALVSERGDVRLVRPLLGVRKRDLIAYLHTRDQSWIDDPSNGSDAFARNRLRRTLDDATISALWYEAQQMGAQRHQDDQARNAWLAQHADLELGTAKLAMHAWRSLPGSMRSDVLSRVIQTVGGKPFRPRLHETTRLMAQIECEPAGQATLGHCLLRWNAQQIAISPEHLDSPGQTSHITRENLAKPLGNTPFWWFSYTPFA